MIANRNSKSGASFENVSINQARITQLDLKEPFAIRTVVVVPTRRLVDVVVRDGDVTRVVTSPISSAAPLRRAEEVRRAGRNSAWIVDRLWPNSGR